MGKTSYWLFPFFNLLQNIVGLKVLMKTHISMKRELMQEIERQVYYLKEKNTDKIYTGGNKLMESEQELDTSEKII